MKKRIFASFIFALLILTGSFNVFAETTPMDEVAPTEDVFATNEPYYTDPITDPVTIPETAPATDPYYSEPASSISDETYPSDYTEPYTGETSSIAETTVPVETTTQVYTNPPEPTEPDENSTYSDYVSPNPVYTPADQDFEAKDWQEIELDLSADPAPGKQSFEAIQKDNSKGNDSIAGFLIAGIVLIFLSIAGFTFVFLYNPFKKPKAKAASGARYTDNSKNRTRSNPQNHFENRKPYNPDDYNDGF